MTHNFKHIIVKREDNQLVCLCYLEKKPEEHFYFIHRDPEYSYKKALKDWEESVVRIPFAINQDVLSLFDKFRKPPFNWSDEVFYEELSIRPREINPELVEIREELDSAWLDNISGGDSTPNKFAYLSSPKEEKAKCKHPIMKLGVCQCCGFARIPVEEVKEEESEDQLWREVQRIIDSEYMDHTNYLKTKFKITRK